MRPRDFAIGGRVGAAKGGYRNGVVESCNVCTETETETETDRELRARAVVSMWFDLITALLDFAGSFGKQFRSVVGVFPPRFVALDL